jgi:NAD(P) transhydrogenase
MISRVRQQFTSKDSQGSLALDDVDFQRDSSRRVPAVNMTMTEPEAAPSNATAVASYPRKQVVVAVLKEVPPEGFKTEERVCATPDTVRSLLKDGTRVVVESGAGKAAGYTDAAYIEAGAEVAPTASGALDGWQNMQGDELQAPQRATHLFCVNLSTVPIDLVGKGLTIITLVNPTKNQDVVDKLREKSVNLIALDLLPRMLSRAQAYDVLSSMANISGYRAVVEAQNLFTRFFQAQTTAAGSQKPAKVLVIGAGVAGLAAIQQAKLQGAEVRAFDVRQTCKEQVEAVGGKFLVVPGYEEADGAGAGGYAKEMTQDFIDAEMALFKNQCEDVDVVITTALIPNRPAPKLILKEAVAAMKPGSVLIDLAAENGGNIEGCVKGETVTTENGAIICGKFPMANEMAAQASTLYSTNVQKFYQSMGEKETFFLDKSDDAVRGAWLLHESEGELDRYLPAVEKPNVPDPEPEETAEERNKRLTGANRLSSFKSVIKWCAAIVALSALKNANVQTLTTFALACLAGSGAVQGVAPALHSPLMSLTNAISGLTVIGGLLLLGQGTGWGATLAPVAVGASALNIGGGFTMTSRMIGMFQRESDISTFPQYNFIAIALLCGALGMSGASFAPGALLVSGIACLSGIAGLGKVSTAPTGNWVGLLGVVGAVSATLTQIATRGAAGLWTQVAGYLGGGLALGTLIGAKAEITQLPQLVALFHSFVGLAAVCAAVGDFMLHGAASLLPSVYAASLVGSLTVSGSLVAFAKLQGIMGGKSLTFPGQKLVTGALSALSGFLGWKFLMTASLAPLLGGTAIWFLLGYIFAAQVGGGDMPIVITLLNSASGWALAAEGFALTNSLLIIVGSLIGSSGLMLSLEMCEAMGAKIGDVLKITEKKKPVGGGDIEVTGEASEVDVATVSQKLKDAKKVVVVPGYGLAVAKAQYAMADIVADLKKNGADVKFMIHPVAGRLPGQLNVLLAEAGVDYDDMLEMDDCNSDADWDGVDLVIVAGANDTVNPLAETEPRCELYGMPVIRCWQSKEVVMMKRSLGIGYAGMANPLMFRDNTLMLLGDAKGNLDAIRNVIESK